MIDREARIIALGELRKRGLTYKLPHHAAQRRKRLDAIVACNPRIMQRARQNVALREYGITLD